MTTTNTNKNYMSGSSVYEIDEKVEVEVEVEVKEVNYGKEKGRTWDYEKLHLGLFLNQRLSLADLEGFTNIEETERSYIRNALNSGSILTDWDDYFAYHTMAKGIDVVHEMMEELPFDEKAKHTIAANFHLNKQHAIDLKLYQETPDPKTRYLLGQYIDLCQKRYSGHENKHYGKELIGRLPCSNLNGCVIPLAIA
jgi:hypothetical protein